MSSTRLSSQMLLVPTMISESKAGTENLRKSRKGIKTELRKERPDVLVLQPRRHQPAQTEPSSGLENIETEAGATKQKK